MFIIFLVWTLYVIITLKKESMVGANKESIKEIATTSKSLALDMKKHEYDPEAMKEGQRKMFIVLQIAILVNAFVYLAVCISTNFYMNFSNDPNGYYHQQCIL